MAQTIYTAEKTIANEPDGHVYVIAGAVFLKTPSIFHRFMAEQREALRPLKIDNWRDVQRQFEKNKSAQAAARGSKCIPVP
ncbi:DNA-binding domain-containing protein [Klebsiella pneumoniae]|uniref:DNA-binding domain-containing protein n=1 Tax=Klebsiella pneumoniae TaxID=573 RepID=A0A927HME8_KLEPN|nr:DNA-binding domain-containing protein [Klebsiella pneumoniae]